MPTVHAILEALEAIAPARYAFDYDKIGLQVGEEQREVTRAVVSLDRSIAAVDHAVSVGAQLLVSHHPLIFRPIESVTGRSHVGRSIMKLIRADIAFIAAHTNWDAAVGGVNDTLAEILGLKDVRSFGSATPIEQLKLVFFCPSASVDAVIDACSEAGAGQIGLYRRCAFMHPGTGTFIGEEGSNPSVGRPGSVETTDEMRVEMVLRADQQRSVVRALSRSHPYEEPAFDLFELAANREQAGGRVGDLPAPMFLSAFSDLVEKKLSAKCLTWGSPDKKVKRVAVVGGAADDEWRSAQREDADVLVTGEVKQHNALEASESGFALLAAGHYATEQPGAAALCVRLTGAVEDVEWTVYDPKPGEAGRPL